MSKTKKQIEETEVDENEIENDELPEDIDSPAILNLLSAYKAEDIDFTCYVYKYIDGKRTLCGKFFNEMPDEIIHFQQMYGGGKFKVFIKDNSTGKMVDSAEVNILECKITAPVSAPVSSSKKEVIEELTAMASLFKSDNRNDNSIELMKMSQSLFKELAQSQKESEKRMVDLMMQIQNKKTDLSDMLEIFTTLDQLRGKDEPTSIVEKIVSSPYLQPLIERAATGIIGGQASPQSLPAPAQAKPSIDDYITEIYKANPKYAENITEENADKFIKILHEQNKNVLDLQTATDIILQIMKNKGIIKKES